MVNKKQLDIEYERYAELCRFAGKRVPMFEEYVVGRGYKLEDCLSEEELALIKKIEPCG